MIYRELGAELKIDDKLPEGPAESFEQLIADQPQWIRDLIEFVTFVPDKRMYNQMATTIDDVLKAHNTDGFLIVVSDSLVKHTHAPNEFWLGSVYGRRSAFSNII